MPGKLGLEDVVVFVMLTCAFYYGCDDLDVIGLTYAKISMYRPSKWLQLNQAAPRAPSQPYSFCTNLGPFTLQLCGVDFEVKNFFAENLNEKIPKRYSLVFLESLPYASTTDPALRTEADLVTIAPLPTTWMF
ncbi:hypothetical protein ACRRTK_002417 [Alexandromys fortis]